MTDQVSPLAGTALARRAERERIHRQVFAEAQVKATQVGRSMKCGGTLVFGQPELRIHAYEPGGCANDGSTCICECHDPKEATVGGD